MRSRLAITGAASLAALSLCAASAIALYGAGPVSALTSGGAQLSGTVLQTALLPADGGRAGELHQPGLADR